MNRRKKCYESKAISTLRCRWQPAAHPMQRMPDGCWAACRELHHGSYRYLFLVNGQPQLDPRTPGIVREPNGWFEAASLITVS